MKAKNLIHLVSVALLFLWGAVLLYFYASGRIVHYLPPDGIFRPMVLVAGVGLVIVGLFNLATIQYAAAGCCGHDHGGGCGHDHGHDHGHDDSGCCGHDHDHKHTHEDCCGHEHGHDHHDHAHAAHDHAHGILDESGALGRIVAILILAAPVTWAAIRTPDQYSANAVVNKGLYNQNYSSTARADQFSLRGDQTAARPAQKKVEPAKTATVDTPPLAVAGTPAATIDLPPAKTSADAPPAAKAASPPASAATPPNGAKEAKSYGGFTLADLEAQVPKSKAGNFILEVPELYYTAGDKEVQSVITGQKVETVAQVLPEKVNNADGRRLRIFRMLVQCCAADARPYSIPAEFQEKAPTFKDMTWVKVEGKMNYKQEGGQTVPLIEVTKIEETTAPDNAMVY